jgi:hypothetical protein
MRFVLGNRLLEVAGGAAVHMRTLGEQLERLGHEVWIYSPRVGPFGEHLRKRGLEITDNLTSLPAECEVVFAQDAIVSYELGGRYPDALHVFRICGDVFDLWVPPQIQGLVDLIVVLCDRYRRVADGAATDTPVLRLRTPIDLDLLVPVTPLRERPRRAALLGNYAQRGDLIREVWGAKGVEVIRIGGANQRFDLADALAEVDIVVAKTRSVMDAMSCGRAVYVYDAFGGDGWVTPESYPVLEADLFTGQATDRVITAAELERDLDDYDPSMGSANRDLIALHHDARAHTVQLLEALADRVPAKRPEAPMRELARLTALQWSWEEQVRLLQVERAPLITRVMQAEQRVSEQSDQIAAQRGRIEQLQGAESRAQALEGQLAAIRGTRAWRLAQAYWRTKHRLSKRPADS